VEAHQAGMVVVETVALVVTVIADKEMPLSNGKDPGLAGTIRELSTENCKLKIGKEKHMSLAGRLNQSHARQPARQNQELQRN
jgi:hypothetical protein